MSANPNQSLTSIQSVLTKLKNGTNVFLTGGAGVGKTYTLNAVKENFENPILLAPTGIAASHIKGETIHSFFGFPVDPEAGIRALSGEKLEEAKKVFKTFDLLVIDEISMVADYLLNWIDRRISELELDIPILIVGDFYQLPPVKGNNNISIDYAFRSNFWHRNSFEVVELTEIKRTQNVEFAKILQDLRVGNVTKDAKKMLKTLAKNSNSDDYTHLYSTNNKAFWHNKKMLDRIKARTYVYEIIEEFVGDSESKTELNDFEFKKRTLKSRFESRLFLKEGALVMYTINKKGEDIYNGKKGVITKLTDDSVWVDGKELEKETIEIYTYKRRTKDGITTTEKKLVGKITQFPIKLAYAITIHKSQGMSIDGLSIDLSYIFAPGQAYVALSRAINPENTYVNLGGNKIKQIFYCDPPMSG